MILQKLNSLVRTNLVGEITEGEPVNGFQVFQGVEHLIKPKF